MQALEWTADNIQAFGGDPSRVGLMGEGGAATELLWILLGADARMDSDPLYQLMVIHDPASSALESPDLSEAEVSPSI